MKSKPQNMVHKTHPNLKPLLVGFLRRRATLSAPGPSLKSSCAYGFSRLCALVHVVSDRGKTLPVISIPSPDLFLHILQDFTYQLLSTIIGTEKIGTQKILAGCLAESMNKASASSQWQRKCTDVIIWSQFCVFFFFKAQHCDEINQADFLFLRDLHASWGFPGASVVMNLL